MKIIRVSRNKFKVLASQYYSSEWYDKIDAVALSKITYKDVFGQYVIFTISEYNLNHFVTAFEDYIESGPYYSPIHEEKDTNINTTTTVNHPSHYGGDNVYEVIRIIEHFKLGFNLGNVLKYVLRAGIKNKDKHIEDLEKAAWYLDREIKNLKALNESNRDS